MIAPLAKFMDWSVIQIGYAMLPQTEELWQKWKQPHDHVSWMFAPGVTRRVLRWLSPRLNISTVEKRNYSASLR